MNRNKTKLRKEMFRYTKECGETLKEVIDYWHSGIPTFLLHQYVYKRRIKKKSIWFWSNYINKSLDEKCCEVSENSETNYFFSVICINVRKLVRQYKNVTREIAKNFELKCRNYKWKPFYFIVINLKKILYKLTWYKIVYAHEKQPTKQKKPYCRSKCNK